jgi:peptide chain release factor 1
MIPEKTIKELINKHSILEKDLSSGTIDKKIFAEKSKEYSDLNEIVEDAKRYITYEKDKIELEKILQDQSTDQELINMAQTELINLKTEYEKNEKKIKIIFITKR